MKLAMKLANKIRKIFSKESVELLRQQINEQVSQELETNQYQTTSGIYVPNYYQVIIPVNNGEQIEDLSSDLHKNVKSATENEIKNNDFNLEGDLKFDFEFSQNHEELEVIAEFRDDKSDVNQTKDNGTKIFRSDSTQSKQISQAENTIKIKAPSQREYYVKLINNNKVIKQFNINSIETNIGRQETNEIVLADRNVSRVHAQIINKKYYCLIRDLNSTNGLLVNGELVKQARLNDGDKIRLGETKLQFSLR